MNLIELSLYWPIYKASLFAFIASVCGFLFLNADFQSRRNLLVIFFAVVYVIITLFMMGYRPPNGVLFGDSSNYHLIFVNLQNGANVGGEDALFYGIMYIFSLFSPYGDSRIFFLAIMTLYLGLIIVSLRRWFDENWIIALAFIVFSSFFISYGVNGIRNGLATSFFLLGLSYKHIPRYILFFLAFSIHSSLALPILAAVLFRYFKNINIYFAGWMVCFLISSTVPGLAAGLGSLGIFDDKLSSYAASNNSQASWGFRLDFIAYGVLPMIVAAFYIYKLKFIDSVYFEIVAIYITASAFWLLVIRIPFSNRFAYLSWFMYGLVLVYPFLKSNYFRYENRYASSLLALVFTFNLIFLY